VYVDGKELKEVKMADGHWEVARPKEAQELGKAMVVVVATGKNGRSSGRMVFV
jgi:hypothetical protein